MTLESFGSRTTLPRPTNEILSDHSCATYFGGGRIVTAPIALFVEPVHFCFTGNQIRSHDDVAEKSADRR